MFETLAYRAFTARKLANLTNKSKDFRAATRLENELLDALREARMLDVAMPTPETQEGNAEYEKWAQSMEGRF